MIDRRALLKDLQGQVRALEKDLRGQVAELDDVYGRLRAEYDRAFRLRRTAATWTAWRDERVTQTAVAWVLGTVFVRFCEDNGLLGEHVSYLAGPEKAQVVLAEESQEEFFARYPAKTDRDWLVAAFDHVGQSQAGHLLFDPRHNAAYQIPISHDTAKALIAFWRRRDGAGILAHDFSDANWDTRFLGDLYQDLSEAARKVYALLQTPEFVEEFILDLTLTPAIDEFGHDIVRAIDPTCGSGHFLLGIFNRLVREWELHAPARDRHEIVRLSLEAVHGVDINPFAVAIARFRLLVAAMRAAGFDTLEQAGRYTFPIQIAIGDSLIKHRQLDLLHDTDELAEFKYATEDLDEYPHLLDVGQYHVVVGNPPYIAVGDKRLRELYRQIYDDVCEGQYTLAIPFVRRFFDLGIACRPDGRGSGYVGQITSNAFMKREFGEQLVMKYLARRVDLTHVVDTSGAFIPGHGTPTVVLVGRSRGRQGIDTIRTVRSVRGEPQAPRDASEGLVWRAIVDQVDRPGSASEWVSVGDLSRTRYFERFPWLLQDGGLETVECLEAQRETRLSRRSVRIGFFGDSHADDVFTLSSAIWVRDRLSSPYVVPANKGDHIRDWLTVGVESMLLPYDQKRVLVSQADLGDDVHRYLWPFRTELWSRSAGGGTYRTAGRVWWQWHQLPRDDATHDWALRFAFVATHNHLVLDRSSCASSRTAPVIKLRKGATEDDHLELLGVLNSSTACFWLKQVSHDKGIRGEGGGFTSDDWERFYEFTGTKLQEFPLPAAYPLDLARELDGAALRLSAVSPAAVVAEGVPTSDRLAVARGEWESTRARMIALQEELDWQVYHLYGLLPDALTAPAEAVPDLKLGERAFEIVLARKVAAGLDETQWFARHGSTPITALPGHWSPAYRAVVERRIAVIESNRSLALIERPECKRRWATDGWDVMCEKALRGWLQDRCEARELWYTPDENGNLQPRPMSTGQLADELRRDADFVAVAECYDPGKDLSAVVADLVETEHVPYLAAVRYTDTGLNKRADWETVWDLQREEDDAPNEPAKRAIRERTPVPPKYTSADFRKHTYWANRGKLDVPKERFISYSHAGRDGDPSQLIGWAGWDHQEQAQVLAVLAVEREQQDGWPVVRLTPLLAGLREVLPWVRQWHGTFDPRIDDVPADVYAGFLAERLGSLHLTEDDLTTWRPPRTQGRRA